MLIISLQSIYECVSGTWSVCKNLCFIHAIVFTASGPLGFGSNSRISFVQKESYRRDEILNQSNSRKRRATDTSSVMVRYRTTAPQEPLLIVSTANTQGVLWVGVIWWQAGPCADITGVIGYKPLLLSALLHTLFLCCRLVQGNWCTLLDPHLWYSTLQTCMTKSGTMLLYQSQVSESCPVKNIYPSIAKELLQLFWFYTVL